MIYTCTYKKKSFKTGPNGKGLYILTEIHKGSGDFYFEGERLRSNIIWKQIETENKFYAESNLSIYRKVKKRYQLADLDLISTSLILPNPPRPSHPNS